MVTQKFENVRNIYLNGKSVQLVSYTITQRVVTRGYMMVNLFAKAGIKKVKQFIKNGYQINKCKTS